MASTIELVIKAKDSASQAVKNLSSNMKDLADESRDFIEQARNLGQAVQVWGQFASQVIQAAQAVYEFGKAGAQIDRMMESGRQLAASFGSDMDKIIDKVKAASLGTVSELDIVAAANRAMMLNVSSDADQLAQLMEVAAVRARAMGLSTTQAFNDIVTGIGRNSPLILDNLGIITKGWAEEAKAAGVAYDQQFILNKVLEQGAEMLKETGGLTRDAAAEYEILEATLQNATNANKQMVNEGLVPTVRWLNETLQATQDYYTTLNRVADAYGMTTRQLRGLREEQDFLTNSFVRAEQLGSGWAKILGSDVSPALAEAQQATFDWNSELDYLKSIMSGGLGKAQDDYNAKIAELKDLYAQARTEAERQDISDKIRAETAAYNERAAAILFNIQQQALLNQMGTMTIEQQQQVVPLLSSIAQSYGLIDNTQKSAIDSANGLVNEWLNGEISLELLNQKLKDQKHALMETNPLLDEMALKEHNVAQKALMEMNPAMLDAKESQQELADGIRSDSLPMVNALAGQLSSMPPSGTAWSYLFDINVSGSVPNVPSVTGGGNQVGHQGGGVAEFHGGGIASGPQEGYPAVLHGTEGVFTQEQMRHLAPAGAGSGMTLNLTYAPVVSTASEDELMRNLAPFLDRYMRQARKN